MGLRTIGLGKGSWAKMWGYPELWSGKKGLVKGKIIVYPVMEPWYLRI